MRGSWVSAWVKKNEWESEREEVTESLNAWITNVTESELEKATDSGNEWITNGSESEGEEASDSVNVWRTNQAERVKEGKTVGEWVSNEGTWERGNKLLSKWMNK